MSKEKKREEADEAKLIELAIAAALGVVIGALAAILLPPEEE